MEFDVSQTDQLLTTTRAVRKRLDLTRPVPRRLILDCVRVSTQAPAGGNYQKWRWVIVDDPDKKAVVADAYRRTFAPYIEQQQRAVERAGNQSETGAIIDSSMHLAEVLQDVPVLAIPCALGSPDDAGSAKGSAQGWWGSIVPAVWSYCLAARSRKLGTAWTTLHLGGEAEVADALGIPDTVMQIACIPTAFYTGDDFKIARRRPAEQVTYWNTWKNTEM
ncbi:MAG: nitroreductase family protein [Actinomycetota bacterium]